MAPADERDRFIDAVRVGSIAVVVLGHWLMAAVVLRGGEPRAANALAAMPWLQPLTWVLQVVPLFFVAAGFASSRALSRPGRRTAPFLTRRVARVVPTPLVMSSTAGLALLVAAAAGAPPSTLRDVGGVVAQPLWFLAVYVLLAVVAPLQLRAHSRRPRTLLVALPLAAVVLDYGRLGLGQTGLASVNYLLVFAFAQELGFWYADGRLGRCAPSRWLAGTVASCGVLVALSTVGPYPVSMIGLPGQMSNMAPPTICVVVLTVGQVSLLMLARPDLVRMLRRPRVWRLVTTGNALALSLFAWHLVALVLAYGALIWLGSGTPSPGSGAWWALKPVVVLAATLVLAGLVCATLPLDRRLAGAPVRSTSTVVAVASALMAGGAFAVVAAWGVAEPFSVSATALFGLHGVPALGVAGLAAGWLLVARPAPLRGPAARGAARS
ncbi:MAG: acyltransferase family protein [Angustibacter sp.]